MGVACSPLALGALCCICNDQYRGEFCGSRWALPAGGGKKSLWAESSRLPGVILSARLPGLLRSPLRFLSSLLRVQAGDLFRPPGMGEGLLQALGLVELLHASPTGPSVPTAAWRGRLELASCR